MQHWQWRRAVESAWFYAAWFCLFAAAVLFVTQRKYGERQAGIERRFQARSQSPPESVAEPATGDEVSADRAATAYSTAQDTIIPLWPLAVTMIVLACIFGVLALRAGMLPP